MTFEHMQFLNCSPCDRYEGWQLTLVINDGYDVPPLLPSPLLTSLSNISKNTFPQLHFIFFFYLFIGNTFSLIASLVAMQPNQKSVCKCKCKCKWTTLRNKGSWEKKKKKHRMRINAVVVSKYQSSRREMSWKNVWKKIWSDWKECIFHNMEIPSKWNSVEWILFMQKCLFGFVSAQEENNENSFIHKTHVLDSLNWNLM